MKATTPQTLRSKKKNNEQITPRANAPQVVTARSAVSTKSAVQAESATKPDEYARDNYDYPPMDDIVPPPDNEFDMPHTAEPAVPRASERRVASNVSVDRADEGEFWHLQAQTENGLELLGKISRSIRKSQTPAAMRTRRLLARGVLAKERDDYIAFVAPEDTFLSLGEPSVMQTLNGVLDELGIEKRARVERTEDDLYADDLKRAAELFGRDCVVPRAD